MVTISSPEAVASLKNTVHIRFFKFFETFLRDHYLDDNVFVVCAGSYPLYYLIKGDVSTLLEKARAERFLKNFVPHDFDLWTNLDNAGKVIPVIMGFISSNPNIEIDELEIMGTGNKYKGQTGSHTILGIVNLRLVNRRTQENSIAIQIICWSHRFPSGLRRARDLLESVVKEFDISICKVGWTSASTLEEIVPFNKQVLSDIRSRQFTLTFKEHENMQSVQNRLQKYISRGFSLKAFIFPFGFTVGGLDSRFVPHMRDVSESESEMDQN